MSITEGRVAAGRRPLDNADLTALLGAFCFFLSAIEYMMPKPLPFLRLGIANLPILLAVDLLPLSWFLVLALVKVIGMSLISGSLFSFVALFSLAGTMAAALTMRAARRLGGKAISAIGVSVLGATASNAAQVFLAMAVVFGEAARLIAPIFLGMGLATGLLLGVFVEGFSRSSAWLAELKGGEAAAGLGVSGPEASGATGSGEPSPKGTPERGRGAAKASPRAERAAERAKLKASRRASAKAAAAERRRARRRRFESLFDPGPLALAGVAISIAFLFQRQLGAKAAMCAAFLVLSLVSGRGFSPLATALTMAGITAANLLVPSGKVLATIGPFPITSGALGDGFDKALVFEGLIFISRISILPTLRLPGRLGSVVARAFKYYDRILERKADIRPATLLRDVDSLVLRVWEGGREGAGQAGEGSGPSKDAAGRRPGRVAAYALLAAATAAAYAALVF